MDKLISIIVPVYGVEKYLHKCVDSIIKQSYKNLEIILIDDGSPDNCGKICDEYAKLDKRIRVIHQGNQGVAVSRNNGLDMCTGDLIAFLDADDSMEISCMEMLYCMLVEESLEISACNFAHYDECNTFISLKEDRFSDYVVDGIEAQKRIWYVECINLAPWGKLYIRELWDGVRFVNSEFYDDYATMHMIYTKVKRFGYTHTVGINYLVRNGSAIRSYNPNKTKILDIADSTMTYCKEYNIDLLPAAICKAVSTYFHIYMQIDDNKHEQVVRIKETVKKYRCGIVKDKRATRKVKIACILSYFGLTLVKYVFRLLGNKETVAVRQ